jgi:hypothetical protein
MLIDERKVHNNGLQHLANLLKACMDNLEGKTIDYDQSGVVQQPQFGMPSNFYEIKLLMLLLVNCNRPLWQLKPIKPVNLVLAHLHVQPSVHKVRLVLYEPIRVH